MTIENPPHEPRRRLRTPARRLNPRFPALGHELPNKFETVEEAHKGIRYVKQELWRFEKSVAFVSGKKVSAGPNTIAIHGLLDLLIDPGNLPVVRGHLAVTLAPLNPWTTAVVADIDEDHAFTYALMISLKDLGERLAESGKGKFNAADAECVADSTGIARGYLFRQDRLLDIERKPTDTDLVQVSQGENRPRSIWKRLVGKGKELGKGA